MQFSQITKWIKHFVVQCIEKIERKWVIDVYKFEPAQYGGKTTRKQKYRRTNFIYPE